MSREIDERVVQMQFNNQQFEQNAATTLGTLAKLKNGLDFSGAAKGLSEFQNAGKNFNLTGVGDAIDGIAGKVTSLANMVKFSLVDRYVNKLASSAERLVKSLSLDQITAGYTKYEQKTTAVQTIMAATRETWEKSATTSGFADILEGVEDLDLSGQMAKKVAEAYYDVEEGTITLSEAAKNTEMSVADLQKAFDNLSDAEDYSGSQMEYVSEQLDRLNWFTDETSYNFTDMTSNIGKFTSAGIDLETAVTAMEGISTWAAISGQNASSASRAMYNLAQAIGVGAVKLMDWRSIENANMATAEFKTTAMETAVSLGVLTKTADGLYKTAKGTEVSIGSFSQSLSEGWFNSDVLLKTLDEYGGFATELAKACDETGLEATSLLQILDKYPEEGDSAFDSYRQQMEQMGISAEDVIPWIEKLNSSEFELGKRAFRAAQEAKTFTEAIDATKDAVSTGWLNTFETIFGNYEEAKELWTDLAERLYTMFAESGNARNSLLEAWRNAYADENGENGKDGREELIEAYSNLMDSLQNMIDLVKNAFYDIFPPLTGERLYDITEKFAALTEKLKQSDYTLENLKTILHGVFSVFGIVKDAIGAVINAVSPLTEKLGRMKDRILSVVAFFGEYVTRLRETWKETDKYSESIKKLTGYFKPLVDFLTNIKNKLLLKLKELTGFDVHTFDALATYELKLEHIKKSIDTIKKKLQDFNDKHGLTATFDKISDFYDKTKTWIKTNVTMEKFVDILHKIGAAAQGVWNWIKNLGDAIRDMGAAIADGFKNGNADNGLLGWLGSVFKQIKNAIYPILQEVAPFLIETIRNVSDAIKAADIQQVFTILQQGSITAGIWSLVTGIKKMGEEGFGLFTSLKAIPAAIKSTLEPVVDWLNSKAEKADAEKIKAIAKAIGILTLSIIALSLIDPEKLDQAIRAFSTLLTELLVFLEVLQKIFAQGNKIGSTGGSGGKGGLFGKIKSWLGIKKSSAATSAAATIMSVAGAILVLSISMALLSAIKPEKIQGAMDAMTILMLELLAFVGVVETIEKKQKNGLKGIKAIGSAILKMAIAVALLSILNPEKMSGAVLALTVLMVAMSAMMYFLGRADHILKSAISIAVISSSLLGLASALAIIALIPTEKVVKSVTALGISILVIAAALLIMPKDSLKKAAGLLIIANALVLVGLALKIMGGNDWGEMARGLIAFIVTLAALVAAVKVLETGKGGVGAAASILILSVSMMALASALKKMSKIEKVGKVLLLVAGALAILIAAAFAAQFVSAGLMILAGVFLAIAASLVIAGIGMVECSAGLLALGAAFVTVSEEFSLGMEILIATFNDRLDQIKDTLKNCRKTIIIIAREAIVILVAIVLEGIVALIEGLTVAIPDIIVAAGNLFMAFVVGLAEILPTVVEGTLIIIIAFINAVADGIRNNADAIWDAVMNILESLAELLIVGIEKLIGWIPGLGDKAVEGLESIRGWMRDAAKEATLTDDDAGHAVGGFTDGIEERTSEAGSSLAGLKEQLTSLSGLDKHTQMTTMFQMDSLLNGRGISIATDNLNGFTDSLQNFTSVNGELGNTDILGMFTEGFNADTASEAATDGMDGLVAGIQSGREKVNAEMQKVGTEDTIEAYRTAMDSHSPSREMIEAGKDDVEGLVQGINESHASARTAVVRLALAMTDKLNSYVKKYFSLGANAVKGYAKGVESQLTAAKAATAKMADKSFQEAALELDSHSPSRRFQKLGQYAAEGFAIGIADYAESASSEAEDMASAAFNAVYEQYLLLGQILDGEMEFTPTVRPVLDLSEIQNGGTGLNTRASVNLGIDSSEITNLRSDINALRSEMSLLREGLQNQTVEHTGTITVNGMNSGNITEVTKLLVKQMRMEARR